MGRLSLPLRILVLTGIAWPAAAQDFLWTTASARSQAMGGVYLPSSRGAIDSLTANPAGLTALSSRTLDLSLSSIFSRGSFTNGDNENSPLRNSPGVVPYGAFGTPAGKSRFSWGVGVIPEIASASTWLYYDAPGVAGASYGMQKQHSAILATQAKAGVGYRVSKAMSIGVSVGTVYNSNTLQAPYIFQSNATLAGLKTLLKLNTSGLGWNAGIGAIVRPTEKLQFNAAWKSKTSISSTGEATGNLDRQFLALGISAPPDFHYSAMVRNILPQSVSAGASMRIDGHWIFALQGNFVNWKQAFARLPVSLTGGNNAAINALLNSTSLVDTVPVQWKNQLSVHAGVERLITENISIQAGFAHSNKIVPASTLSPLTAAILTDRMSTGIEYRKDKWHFDLGYSVSPLSSLHVTQSALKSGEYSNSVVRVGSQALTLTTSLQFR